MKGAVGASGATTAPATSPRAKISCGSRLEIDPEQGHHDVAVAQKSGTNMEPWYVEAWTKACVTPPM